MVRPRQVQHIVARQVAGAELLEVQQFGPSDTLELNFTAGGPHAIPGDYMWSSERMPYAIAGQWGVLRVLPKRDEGRAATSAELGQRVPRSAGAGP